MTRPAVAVAVAAAQSIAAPYGASVAYFAGAPAGSPGSAHASFAASLERAGAKRSGAPPAPSAVGATSQPTATPVDPRADKASDEPDAEPVGRGRRHVFEDAPMWGGFEGPLAAPSPAPPPGEIQGAARCLHATAALEPLLVALVRRVAWSGDGRRGVARLELGAGPLAGATIVVHADEGRIRVHVDVPPGVDLPSWRARIVRSLAARRLLTDEVEVA
jgi:hypothetical protein